VNQPRIWDRTVELHAEAAAAGSGAEMPDSLFDSIALSEEEGKVLAKKAQIARLVALAREARA